MKLIKLKKREKYIVYIIGGILTIFLIERFFFSGLRSKIRNLKTQIKLQEVNLKTGITIRQQKDKILQERERFKSYLEIARSSSEREIVARFLKEIEKIAASSGISIISLSPQNEPEQHRTLKKYNADLRAEGSLQKIFDFLHKVQNSDLLIEIDKFSLATKTEEGDILKLETTISIVIPL